MRNPGALVVSRCAARPARRSRSSATPNNRHGYVPQLSLIAPVPKPVNVDDLIHDRFAGPEMAHDGVERVIAYEPGSRFGTGMVTGGHRTTGAYEFVWAHGQTQIIYRCTTNLTLPEAWLGNGFRRAYITGKLKAARDAVMQRIKGLLEAEVEAVTV